jgi:hypothetical protein
MVMLAHVRSAFALSNGTYDSPRVTRELQDNGFTIGRRCTARQKRRFKRTDRQLTRLVGLAEHQRPEFHCDGTQPEVGVDSSYV